MARRTWDKTHDRHGGHAFPAAGLTHDADNLTRGYLKTEIFNGHKARFSHAPRVGNLEVIGNNVANANTYGFKSARAEFADMYATSMNGTGASNIGIGVNLSAVAQQFTQGNIVTTENPMDLAINGGGFFQVSDGTNPTRYSRNGQFKVSKDGFIVNNDGLKLMGYPANGAGVIQPGKAQPLQLPTGGIPPAVTSAVKMEFNLDSRLKVTAPSNGTATGLDLKDSTTYNNATSLTVYDAKGQDVNIFVEAAKDPAPADTGAKANAGLMAVMPIFQEIFIGRLDADKGVPQAQEEGNAAMAE